MKNKTRLCKMVLYITDFGDDNSGEYDSPEEYYKNYIDMGLNTYNSMNMGCHIEDFNLVEIDWYDDIDINQNWAIKEDFDRYFE